MLQPGVEASSVIQNYWNVDGYDSRPKRTDFCICTNAV